MRWIALFTIGGIMSNAVRNLVCGPMPHTSKDGPEFRAAWLFVLLGASAVLYVVWGAP